MVVFTGFKLIADIAEIFLGIMFGLLWAGPTVLLGSIALILGGIVSLGSNISTLHQTEAAIDAAESLRSELIGRIDLQMVHDAPMKLM